MPENAYFQGNPTRLDVSRSKMSFKPRWTGDFVAGRLVPIFATSLIMPGDTVKMDIAGVIRSVTPIFPVMDDMDITIEAYFVPHRLVLSRKSMSPDVNDSNHSWAAFLGAQDSLLNMPTPGDVELPYFGVAKTNYVTGGLADCLGFAPPAASGGSYKVNCLKPLAYFSIWNEFWREPNCESAVTYTISSGQVLLTGSDAGLSSNTGNISSYGLAPVCRYHGYFGSALPWPQRNTTSVALPLGDKAPVVVGANYLSVGDSAGKIDWSPVDNTTGKVTAALTGDFVYASVSDVATMRSSKINASDQSVLGSVRTSHGFAPRNLWADLSEATAANINQLRFAIQTQRWYEALARGGNKLEDLTYSMFGVRGPSVATRPEYLGGVRVPISISQVAATAGSIGEDGYDLKNASLGATGAFSLSNLNKFLFSKSFTEHGTLMVVACVRVHDSFGQGISREDTKFDRFQYYWPQFASLGEQKIECREIYVDGAAVGSHDHDTFGYQEAWAEYRMLEDKVVSHCRPGGDLDMITYCNNFSSVPTLKSFLSAASQVDNVDKTLQYDHQAAGFQFYGQFQFNMVMTRPMPLYSIPGLMDHH